MAAGLTDAWANVRYEALRSLQALGGTTTYRSQVIGRLLDADPRLQALSARIVGGICGDIASSVKPSLQALLASTNFRVRYEAALALLALGDTSGQATMQADRALPNPSHALLASQAYGAITAAKK